MARKSIKACVYRWEGVDTTGASVSGELSGQTPALIKARLRQQGITPRTVRKKTTPLFHLRDRIEAHDITLFTRQLATMIKAGVPLLQAFAIICEGFANPHMRSLVQSLKQDVSGGSSFAASLRRQPRYFDELYCNLIDAGEQAGALDSLLERVAIHRERQEHLKARISKAITYPLAVVVVAILVTGILLVNVVPQFESMFAGFDAELPGFTLLVIGLSEFMQRWYWLLLGGLCGALLTVRFIYRRSPALSDWLQAQCLKLPLIGGLLQKSAVTRYARTLSITFAAGVPLLEALVAVAGATGNVVYKRAVLRIRQEVATGMQLHAAMRASGVFPHMAVQMTAIGEESGALDDMLEKVASYYETQVDTRVDQLTSLLEPLIMVILGVVVGGLVVALYLPIFQLGSAI